MNHFEYISIPGTVFAIRYIFPKRGDGIPMHEHETSTAHWVYVERGKVRAYGRDRSWVVELHEGQRYDFGPDEQQHEIAALEPDTLIWNVYHNSNRRLPPPDMREGVDPTPLTIPLE